MSTSLTSLKQAALRGLAALTVASVAVAVLWLSQWLPSLPALQAPPGLTHGLLALGLVVAVRLLSLWRLRP